MISVEEAKEKKSFFCFLFTYTFFCDQRDNQPFIYL